MAGTHARMSASSAKRWLECPGSQVRVDLVGDVDDETEYAAEGTAAHEVAARALKEGKEPWEYIGQVVYTDDSGKAWECTVEMAEHVAAYTGYIRTMYGDGIEMLIEEKLSIPELGDDAGGSVDCAVHRLMDGGGFVHVIDFKYGIGVSVPVGETVDGKTKLTNTQMLYYLYLILRKLGVSRGDSVKCGATIVQPRDNFGDPIREAWATSDEVFDWAETQMIPGMARANEAGAELKPGEWCQFCPAKLICPTMKGMFGAAATADPHEIPEMTTERLGAEYALIDPVKKYIKALEDEAYKRALSGDTPPGTQLEKGKANRQWKDGAEEAAKKQFGDAAYTEPTLKSPAQLENEVGGAAFVAQHAFKPEPRPVLKLIKPGREAVPSNFGGGVFAGVKA